MFKYRPHRGTLDAAMKEEMVFITMDHMFDYIVKSDPFHLLQKEDLSISENLGKDDRIDWTETRNVLTKRYGKDIYDTPKAIGWCSMEDYYNPIPETKNIYIGGISRHHLLKMLYDAAKPYDKTISIEEAADVLHNTVGTITQLKGKKLYVNVLGKEFDGTEYDKINGIGLSYTVVTYMRHHRLFGKYPWEIGIPDFDGDRLDTLYTSDKVSKTDIPDAMIDKEDKNDFAHTLAKIEADRASELESFKTRMAAAIKPELEKLYKSILNNKDGSTVTNPVQNLYSVICDDKYKQDYIIIRANNIDDAWNIFWEKRGNVETGDFGNKDLYNPIYERFDRNPEKLISRTYKRKNGYMTISFEKLPDDSDYIYLGGCDNINE